MSISISNIPQHYVLYDSFSPGTHCNSNSCFSSYHRSRWRFDITIPVAYLSAADFFVHYFHLEFVVVLVVACLLAADLVALHFLPHYLRKFPMFFALAVRIHSNMCNFTRRHRYEKVLSLLLPSGYIFALIELLHNSVTTRNVQMPMPSENSKLRIGINIVLFFNLKS